MERQTLVVHAAQRHLCLCPVTAPCASSRVTPGPNQYHGGHAPRGVQHAACPSLQGALCVESGNHGGLPKRAKHFSVWCPWR
eukprot:5720189-Alexandrium_andersonii.AAC.1